MKNICSVESMRQMEERFNEENCIDTLSLLRGKQFYQGRLLERYRRVILDGTGLFYFKERHYPNCLSETRKKENGGEKRYYHKVLGDALYTVEPVMKLCRKNGWSCLFIKKRAVKRQ